MAVLPVISGREVVKALEKIGFKFHHQKSSHNIIRRRETLEKQNKLFYGDSGTTY